MLTPSTEFSSFSIHSTITRWIPILLRLCGESCLSFSYKTITMSKSPYLNTTECLHRLPVSHSSVVSSIQYSHNGMVSEAHNSHCSIRLESTVSSERCLLSQSSIRSADPHRPTQSKQPRHYVHLVLTVSEPVYCLSHSRIVDRDHRMPICGEPGTDDYGHQLPGPLGRPLLPKAIKHQKRRLLYKVISSHVASSSRITRLMSPSISDTMQNRVCRLVIDTFDIAR